MTANTVVRVVRLPSTHLILAAIAALVFAGRGSTVPFVHAQTSTIVAENALPGNPASEWDVIRAGDPTIQGFATDISVDSGHDISFKVNTDATGYTIDVYRLGYYGGSGARWIATVPLSVTPPQNQPACLKDLTTGLADCGNWDVSATWSTVGAVSGIYVARLKRTDTGGASHMVFVVRDDARRADVVVQTSDTTWQAYNRYGRGSLYCGGPQSNEHTVYTGCSDRATKVSYNRPIDTRDHDPQSFLFNAEYPMVRWLEANGYDVKYISGVDTERHAADLIDTTRQPKVFISSGHDEYWSAGQRESVEAARDHGVSLAFFSGNELYWKTRWENSIDGSGTPFKTLVSYKDTLGGVKLDPMPGVSTGTWRDTRFGPPVADGGRPENSVTGTIWTVNDGTSAITVPASMAGLRFWRDTRVADLTSGSTTLGVDTLGYEWDEDLDNGARPSGLVRLSSTTVPNVEKIIDVGQTVAVGAATHSLTLYRHESGALVFGAGTVQWAWGLDVNHDRRLDTAQSDVAMQQATLNLLADMGVQPASKQGGLIGQSASTDAFAPTSSITSPVNDGTVGSGDPVTITGTAADSDGVVAGVEVSLDGGATWHAAQGTTAWSYEWSPGVPGSAAIRSRAVDDSGNRETPGTGIVVTIAPSSCPCPSFWTPETVPAGPASDDPSAVELGLKFRTDFAGIITGVRFYKAAGNVGTHIGNLWTSGGTLMDRATFSNETASGWQEVLFDQPVPVTANTTYVVSYHTNVGHYAASGGYFSSHGLDRSPLHAPPSSTSNGNGVFWYGPTGFPTETYNATNYWVDVVFSNVVDIVPPIIGDVRSTPIDSAVAVITWTTNEPSTSSVDYSTDGTIPPLQTVTVSDAAYVRAHSVRLTGLHPNTAYKFHVRSADRAGNSASSPSSGQAPPSGGPGGGGTQPDPGAFTTPSPALHDTTTADFKAGTLTGTYVSETVDGELTLAPATGSEFSGTTMPAGWATLLSPGGSAIVAGGRMVADGARVASCVGAGPACAEVFTLGPGASVEFVATFSGNPYQHSGLGQMAGRSNEPFAFFSTLSGGSLYIRTNDGTNETVTDLGLDLLGEPHLFRIDWQPSQVVYSVDGVQVGSPHPVAIGGLMRPIAASEYEAFSGDIIVDWVRVMPYAPSGTFVSRVFDAGATVSWHGVHWTSTVPAGSSLAITVCSSERLTTGGLLDTPSCSTPFTTSPQSLSAVSRYVQYRADLMTSDADHATPELSDISITGSTQVTTAITWAAPAAITYGTPLGATQLNAALAPAAAGTMVYTPAGGTILGAGARTLSVAFTPDDPTSFTTATTEVTIIVEQATPSITWNAPAAIAYPAALGADQLNATASVPGTFVYTPPAGTTLSPGTSQTLSVAFTPDDTANYTTATATVTITVNKATPTISWSAPANITYGTALGAAQLNATASVPGTFVYLPAAPTVLSAGAAQALSVTFAPTDAVHYATTTAGVMITVDKVTPAIIWNAPATIISGTALSATQLNATASVPGSFVYLPGIGTVLAAGPAQPLLATFTPTDAVNYTTATRTVPITVLAMITVTDLSITEGNVTGSTKQAWLTVKLAQKSSAWVTVNYTTTPGTANADVDYYTISDVAYFSPGVLTQSIAIPIVQDTVGESTESFYVDFSGVVNGVLGQGRATITIVNDDSSTNVVSSIAEFSAGTLGGGAYLSETANGELMLAPQGSEFSGTSLPAGWTSTPLATGAASTVANGMLAINGAALIGPSETGSGQALEFTASFSNSPDQRVGLGSSSALGSPMAMFIVRSSDRQLYARTMKGTTMVESPMAGIDWLGKPHRYQITWTATGVQYYIDGTLMISHSMAWTTVTMRPVIVDTAVGDGVLGVDWIRMTPYSGSGSFTSAVFDAAETVLWQKLTTNSTVPSGTTSTITYRRGDTATPDASWTAFSPLGAGGVLAGSSRYMQFAIQIATTSGAKSPVIQDVTVTFKR